MGCDRIPENGLLVLPFQVEDGDEVYDVTEIGMGAFHGSFDMGVQFDQLLQHLVIPDTVKKIGASAFSGDTKLETVRLSQNLERIESNAFTGCPNLAELVLPAGITSFAPDALGTTGPVYVYGQPGSAQEAYAETVRHLVFLPAN